jgi:hypothetical protein
MAPKRSSTTMKWVVVVVLHQYIHSSCHSWTSQRHDQPQKTIYGIDPDTTTIGDKPVRVKTGKATFVVVEQQNKNPPFADKLLGRVPRCHGYRAHHGLASTIELPSCVDPCPILLHCLDHNRVPIPRSTPGNLRNDTNLWREKSWHCRRRLTLT